MVDNTLVCDCDAIHTQVVERVKGEMPDATDLAKVNQLFKLLADNTRLNIMLALTRNEMCVCDLSAMLGMTKSAISHQLAELRQARLVKFRRDGKNVFYTLDDQHVVDIVEEALQHARHG